MYGSISRLAYVSLGMRLEFSPAITQVVNQTQIVKVLSSQKNSTFFKY